MQFMAGGSKSFFDRILRTEGSISLLQHINSAVGYALGGGALTAAITWLQGALSQFGFAGYVVVFLIVSILTIMLLRMISDFRKQSGSIENQDRSEDVKSKIPKRMANLEACLSG
jgi:membrane protein implicated in regulation of membrane protease activity